MTTKLMMTPSEVVDYAFATGEYVAVGAITQQAIAAAQQRYLIPLLGEEFANAIAEGSYEQLREEYVAPTLGILSRIESELDAYPPTPTQRQRAKLFLRTLTDYLNANEEQFELYDARSNVMNRCSIVGGFVL